MLYPLAVCAVGVVTSIIGTFFVRLGANQSIMGALYKGFIATGVLSIIALWPVTDRLLGMGTAFSTRGISFTGCDLFWCGVVGLVVTALIIVVTEYYTGTNYRPVRSIAKASETGHGTNVIQGLAVSLEATALPALIIVAGIIISFKLAGPVRHRHRGDRHAVARRRGGGARRLRSRHRQRRRHRRDGRPAQGDPQDHRRARRRRQHHQGRHQGLRHRLGGPRRARAVRRLQRGPEVLHRQAKPGSIFYGLNVDNLFSLSNPYVVVGLFIGGLLPYLFGGITMTAVGRAAGSIVEEVRRQFKEKPGIMQGTEKPDYAPRRRHADARGDQGDDRPLAAAGAVADRRASSW